MSSPPARYGAAPGGRTPLSSRKALNERSRSETNIPPSPTIRIVEEPDDTTVYARSPFPIHPSQVLPPHQKPGYSFEDQGSSLPQVSDENTSTLRRPKSLVPSPLQPRKPHRQSYSTASSSTDSRRDRSSISASASTFSPDSSRLSQGTYTTPPSSPGLSDDDVPLAQLRVVREEPSHSTIRTVIPSSPPEAGPLTYKSSEASLASSASDGTAVIRRIGDSQGSSQGTPSPSNFQKTPKSVDTVRFGSPLLSSSPNWYPTQASSSKSAESIAESQGSQRSQGSRRRDRSSSEASSNPQSIIRYPVHETSVQYPIVRSPSSSSSWADSSSPPPLPVIPPQVGNTMQDLSTRPPQWSPRLSVIASESGRSSFSLSQAESARRLSSPRRQTPYVPSSSSGSEGEYYSSQPPSSAIQPPPPLFHPGPTRVFRLPPESRESDEQEDVLHELQAPPLRHKRSGYRERWTWDSRPSSSRPSSSTRPGSTQSESPSERSTLSLGYAQNFPSWARRYYSLGDRASVMFFQSNSELSLGRTLSRIGTAASNRSFNGVNPNDHSTPYLGRLNTPHSLSTGPSGSPLSATFPYSFSIFHPRKRPRYIPRKSSKRRGKAPMRQIRAESTDISETNTDNDVYIRGRRSRYTSEQFVPRLGKDRRTMHRMSRWTAPSLDEQMSPIFSPVNRQITLFCFGFLIPFSWMVAAALPLPEKPVLTYAAMREIGDVDEESAIAIAGDPLAWKYYNKAKWWRNLNRIMSAIGLLIIGAVITLAIISTRFRA